MLILLAGLALGGPCDSGAVDQLVEALAVVQPEHRVELASMGLSEACPGHAGLAGAAAMIAQMPPEHRSVVDAKAAADNPFLWIGVCEGGLEVAAKSVQVAPAEKRPLLWRECGLGSTAWFSESEWNAASGLVFVSLEGGHALREAGFSDDIVRTVVRGLAGIGGGAPAAPIGGIDLVQPLPDLGLPDMAMPTGSEAGFVERPQVKWNRAARNAKKKVCKVEVTVRKSGELGKIAWVECPEALRKSVEKALNKADYEVATEDGQPVRSTFKTRFTVR